LAVAVITGSAGLIGSEAVRCFAGLGLDVVGIDNDMRSYFFGASASTSWNRSRLEAELPLYRHESLDIRDEAGVAKLFDRYGTGISLVVHAAAQPSHDWAAREPLVDFDVNARGTLVLLEAARRHAPEASFVYLSTNKVYGDRPNLLPLHERETRWEIEDGQRWSRGIDETMPVDQCLHSLFGASKLAADLMVQEYGRYFGMRTACFRGGCLTGPAHSGAELHGFLAYLMQCAINGQPYRIFGYKGKQVRDNIHSADLVAALAAFWRAPRSGEVYNIGGSRFSNCSMLEAIRLCEAISGREMMIEYCDENRVGDHMWWISDVAHFQSHYPDWRPTRDVPAILREIHEAQMDRSAAGAAG